MADDFGFFSSSESGVPEAAEEDPAAAFLAQQESEIAGIENDEGFGAPAGVQAALAQPGPANGGESAQWPGNSGAWDSHRGTGQAQTGPPRLALEAWGCAYVRRTCGEMGEIFGDSHWRPRLRLWIW